ncbi:amino acid permease [Saxibacter everestensis]|uniref:Amino acid permease n=1 Tax=Saxibacter everestensis TaxID=2909229 RepID=A0ABY8QQ82_9MICO|nr:amino acid permease [Brevibacteriaceae bacterium ZFBP1038]
MNSIEKEESMAISHQGPVPETGQHDGSAPEANHLSHGMSTRQITMMSLGTAIGTGLFVGSAAGIGIAGPAIVISYAIAGVLLIFVMRMLGEMAAAHPSSGSFSTYAEKALGKAGGATIGWVWWFQMMMVAAIESVVAGGFLAGWTGLPQWLMTLVILLAFTGVNMFQVSRFGELEFWFASIKVAAVIAFLVIGIVAVAGLIGPGSPGLTNISEHGGVFPNGVTGMFAGLLAVIFSFGGIEVVALAAAESNDPGRNIQKAVRNVVWRILLFYVGSMAIMVLVLPWNSFDAGDDSPGPFVQVLSQIGLPYADIIMQIIIMVSLLSALNATLYAASRMAYSLSSRGQAPRLLQKVGTNGVPRVAVVASSLVGLVVVLLSFFGQQVFMSLLSAVGSTLIILFCTVTISHIILRRRYESSGDTRELPFKMWAFPYLSWITLGALLLIIAMLLANSATRAPLLMLLAITAVIALCCVWHNRGNNKSPLGNTLFPPEDSSR